MPGEVNLFQLADLALKVPEVGAVNFNYLHRLLVELIKRSHGNQEIHAQDDPLDKISPEKEPISLEKSNELPRVGEVQKADENGGQIGYLTSEIQRLSIANTDLESKVADLKEEIKTLSQLPSNNQLIDSLQEIGRSHVAASTHGLASGEDATKSVPSNTGVAKENRAVSLEGKTSKETLGNSFMTLFWKTMKHATKIGSLEDGVEKLFALFQDLMMKLAELKENLEYSKQELKDEQERLTAQQDQDSLILSELKSLTDSHSSELNSVKSQLADNSSLLDNLKSQIKDLADAQRTVKDFWDEKNAELSKNTTVLQTEDDQNTKTVASDEKQSHVSDEDLRKLKSTVSQMQKDIKMLIDRLNNLSLPSDKQADPISVDKELKGPRQISDDSTAELQNTLKDMQLQLNDYVTHKDIEPLVSWPALEKAFNIKGINQALFGLKRQVNTLTNLANHDNQTNRVEGDSDNESCDFLSVPMVPISDNEEDDVLSSKRLSVRDKFRSSASSRSMDSDHWGDPADVGQEDIAAEEVCRSKSTDDADAHGESKGGKLDGDRERKPGPSSDGKRESRKALEGSRKKSAKRKGRIDGVAMEEEKDAEGIVSGEEMASKRNRQSASPVDNGARESENWAEEKVMPCEKDEEERKVLRPGKGKERNYGEERQQEEELRVHSADEAEDNVQGGGHLTSEEPGSGIDGKVSLESGGVAGEGTGTLGTAAASSIDFKSKSSKSSMSRRSSKAGVKTAWEKKQIERSYHGVRRLSKPFPIAVEGSNLLDFDAGTEESKEEGEQSEARRSRIGGRQTDSSMQKPSFLDSSRSAGNDKEDGNTLYPSAAMQECLLKISELAMRQGELADQVQSISCHAAIDGAPQDPGIEGDDTYLSSLARRVEENRLMIESLKSELSAMARVRPEFSSGFLDDPNVDVDVLSGFRRRLKELENKLKHLTSVFGNHRVSTDDLFKKNQQQADAIYAFLDELNQNKADKNETSVQKLLDAYQTALDSKVNVVTFDKSVRMLDQGLQDALHEIDAYKKEEVSLREALDKLADDVGGKLDSKEGETLRKFMERKVADIKKNRNMFAPLSNLEMDPKNAAGFRKPMQIPFHCISCDRPVDFSNKGLLPPISYGLPSKRSKGPTTAFEMDQVRRNRLTQAAKDFASMNPSYPFTERPCGGHHTAFSLGKISKTYSWASHAREERVAAFESEAIREREPSIVDALQGKDGNIYRGRYKQSDLHSQVPMAYGVAFTRNQSQERIHNKGKKNPRFPRDDVKNGSVRLPDINMEIPSMVSQRTSLPQNTRSLETSCSLGESLSEKDLRKSV